MTNPTPTTWDLTGKTAVVTGGARGIGAATAVLLRERGASVVVSDLSETVRAQESERCATLVGDASDEDVARATVELAVKRFGGLDILVNNAGRTLNKPVTETSVEDFDAIMATNARGNFVHAREAFRVMQNTGGGSIVSVASVSSVVAFETQVAYAASKGALAQITRVLAIEGGPPRHPQQRRAAWGGGHRHHARRGGGRARDARQLRAGTPHRAYRPARRGRRGRGLPDLAGGLVHHRRAARGRRRLDRPLANHRPHPAQQNQLAGHERPVPRDPCSDVPRDEDRTVKLRACTAVDPGLTPADVESSDGTLICGSVLIRPPRRRSRAGNARAHHFQRVHHLVILLFTDLA